MQARSASAAAGSAPDPADGPMVVGPRSRFEGLLTFRGRAQIEGELRGGAVGEGRLRIGPGARVEGDLEADELVVHGSLRGDAVATLRIELGPTARVSGSIRAPRISLADGCLLEGRCEMPVAPGAEAALEDALAEPVVDGA